MKPNDFVEYRETGSMGRLVKLGRVTKVDGYAVHVSLFNGSRLVVDEGHLSPAPILDVWRAIEEEIALVEERAANRVRELRAESRTVFDQALAKRVTVLV
jgi:hypothetical protein